MTLYEFAMHWIREIFDHFQPRKKCIEAVDIEPKTQEMFDDAVRVDPWLLGGVPEQYITQGMCNEAFEEEPYALECIPDQYITRGMCNEIMRINSGELYLVPDCFKIEETCIKALKVGTWRVPGDVPDCFKTRDVCEKAMRKSPSSFMYVPDWFVTKQQIKMWRDDDEYRDDDDIFIEW